ncbi:MULTISPECIES: TIGR03619 family F420-dependent LLM class oxidoreductase [Streptomyces]|uniref:TIGR03619 family F420-dependent LLM class oxidoreductase n=1 Tax=Streptomyces TaxID=1883 RepID=UPI001E563D60|nr:MULTISPECIES: TIGR03619 family F420-dependent LLM class oxidoreductase [Streptomyces]UFQ18991.1 TIGR03619 family F420-dependent LLM class oxidoreductase [Streptomyces huasconensis]WCL88610.1 TIGR03619 family F420-dependent LLM class oxidoreductase [Streptomyces sp. JCM 35825]
MKISASVFQTTRTAKVTDLARRLEETGYDALYFCEHTHQSLAFARQAPTLERRFRETFDPFVAAQAAAAVTERLRVGSAISLLAQHEPISMAKRLASLDRLVDGRLDVGVGAGWIEDEMRRHGVDPARRNARLTEHALAVRALWSGEPTTIRSEHLDFEDVVVLPTPLQRPGPPLLVAGAGPRAPHRVRAFGDGWMPDFGSVPLPELLKGVAAVREIGRQQGRHLPIVVMGVPHDPAVITVLAEAGVDQVATLLPSAPLDEIDAFLAPYEAALCGALGVRVGR